MPYSFGARSLANRAGMLPALAAVFDSAITDSKVDFGFTERQVRDLAYQRQLVARGVSQTLKSNHLVQPDGFGHAGDPVPYVAGTFTWDWQYVYEVAAAMARAAHRLGCADRLCWGGVWSRWVGDYAGPQATAADMRAASEQYVATRRAHGLRSFQDGPHWQYGRLG